MRWEFSHKADAEALPLADRHYSRTKVGSAQFGPAAPTLVLKARTPAGDVGAIWVTSRPMFRRDAWARAWHCTVFRNERPDLWRSSELVTEAVAATCERWPSTPELGMITFVDAERTRHKRDPGRCFRRAGFEHVGFTAVHRLVVLQLVPESMPLAERALGQMILW